MTNQGYFSNINAIVETSNFSVFVPRCPHVDRNDGGHICIATNKNDKYTIFDLNEEELFELSILTKEAGKALFDVTNERGIDVKLINYQINGNWSFGTKSERRFMFIFMEGLLLPAYRLLDRVYTSRRKSLMQISMRITNLSIKMIF